MTNRAALLRVRTLLLVSTFALPQLPAHSASELTAALRMVTCCTGVLAPHETTSSDEITPAVQLTGLSTSEQDAAYRTVQLFADAGLELPPVTIRRHHDTTACNGHDGLHHSVDNRSEIDICTVETDNAETRVILHELTHAWAFHFLTPERKEAFKQLRGWEYWLDYNHAEWKDNGTEQAAEIMVWALSDEPIHVNQIDHNSCAELHAGYVALTGREPLHGYTDRCDDVSSVQRS
jgi:hypothetical protein